MSTPETFKKVSPFLKRVVMFSSYSGFITLPAPVSYYFISYFLELAPATKMGSFQEDLRAAEEDRTHPPV